MTPILQCLNQTFIAPNDLTGKQILRIVWYSDLAVEVYCIALAVNYFLFRAPQGITFDLGTLQTWTMLAALMTYLVIQPLQIYLLWNAIKKISKKGFRYYIILRIIRFASSIFVRISFNIANFIIVGFTWGLDVYAILLVAFYHTKLDSPFMMRFKESLGDAKKSCHTSQDDLNYKTENISAICNNSPKKYIISSLDLVIDKSGAIGEGAYGVVHKGIMVRNGSKVSIVAKAARTPINPATFDLVLMEAKILIHAEQHENIVKFFGITSDARLKDDFSIINEYCGNESLKIYLNKHRDSFRLLISTEGDIHDNDPTVRAIGSLAKNPIVDLFRFAKEVAAGMEHLARKKIVHGDLATRNVLLTQNLKCKITDFGLSRRLYNYQLYLQPCGDSVLLPWRWMSIEALEDLKFSEKSDVWSYGVLIWEIFTLGNQPFGIMSWTTEFVKCIRDGLRLPKPSYGSLEIYRMMETCWNLDVSQRPTFEQIKTKFELNITKN